MIFVLFKILYLINFGVSGRRRNERKNQVIYLVGPGCSMPISRSEQMTRASGHWQKIHEQFIEKREIEKNHFTHHLLWTRIVSQYTRTIKTIRIGYFYLQNLKTILQLPLDWLRRCFEGVLILLLCGVRFLAVLPSFVVPVQGWLWYRFIDIFYVRSGHCWRRNRSSN